MSERAALAGRVVDFPSKPEARPYLDAYSRPFGEPFWLLRQREQALARFAEVGFPSRKSESWRYIDLEPLKKTPILPREEAPTRPSAALFSRLAEAGIADPSFRLVLLDGCFAPELSSLDALPEGVRLTSTRAAILDSPERLRAGLAAPPESFGGARDRPFSALNAAFFRDGFVLEVAPGVAVERPFEIVHLFAAAAPASLHTRSFVALGDKSRATLFESFLGEGRYWRNDVVEVALAAGAALSRFLLIEEGGEAVHTGEGSVTLGAGARFHSSIFLFGGRTVREEAIVKSEGAGTRSVLNAAALISGREEANIVTAVEHAAPAGETRELVKMAAAGRAHGAFQGRITVNPGAQKVDAHQLSQNLILSPRAALDTKPELEIFADDVKCSHGAAVGDIDEGALFYLRSRGIALEEARRLVVEAFLREVLAGVEEGPLKAHLSSRLVRRLKTLEELG
jgi:Fe-S cluster assembly protein SufD